MIYRPGWLGLVVKDFGGDSDDARPSKATPRDAASFHVHVAVVGLNRAPQDCFPSIDSQIVSPLRRATDIRLTVSATLIVPRWGRISNPRSSESGRVSRWLPDFWRKNVVRLKSNALKRSVVDVFEILRQGRDRWGDDFKSSENYLLFLAASKTTWAANANLRAADVVVFARPDIRISGHLDVEEAARWCFSQGISGIPSAVVPEWPFKGLNDRFAVLGALCAERYFTRLEGLVSLTKSPEGFHSETLLELTLEGCEVRESFPGVFVRMRIGGVPEPRDIRRMPRSLKDERVRD